MNPCAICGRDYHGHGLVWDPNHRVPHPVFDEKPPASVRKPQPHYGSYYHSWQPTREKPSGVGELADGSIRFKLVGGPMDGAIYRVFPPYFEPLRFTDGSVYRLDPPSGRRKKQWVFMFQETNESEVAS